MRSDCPSGLSLACWSGLIAAVRQRCRGKGVFLASGGKRGREPKTPAVGLRDRCCVVKPDPITTQGQSPWGASEGEGRLSAASAAAHQRVARFVMFFMAYMLVTRMECALRSFRFGIGH